MSRPAVDRQPFLVQPVVGMLTPYMDQWSTFNTGFMDGLVCVRGPRLDILAIVSQVPGQGDFRRFIKDCQAQYATIFVWAITNPLLFEVMPRYGFQRTQAAFYPHEPSETVLRWGQR